MEQSSVQTGAAASDEAASEAGMPSELSLRGEDLGGKLAGYPGPVFRKAYLTHLLDSGRKLLLAGNERMAVYCFDKVAKGLEEDALEQAKQDIRARGEGSPAEAPKAPALDRLRDRWRQERVRDAEQVLARHTRRLSPLENQAYGEKLQKLKSAGEAEPQGIQAVHASVRADATLLDLRRRLYRRILKSQKSTLTRKRPETSTRLPTTVAGMAAQVVGPYNDRYNLEDLLALLAGTDPAWVDEFIELYGGLAQLKGMAAPIPSTKK